ncbi:formin-homology and zinc finger domains protein 1-like isoform X1 [Bombus terrestris]|uniref:Formin-homology and zinc finger domains protein 1-like isoform X1 n=1 Tax=Bombus terrestris TaxID=30195 RepID=A0A9C6W783_BOMTE|nr:formin-homology and zinc finger domains protein 1-like isoform X1 [Bombus terrestris]
MKFKYMAKVIFRLLRMEWSRINVKARKEISRMSTMRIISLLWPYKTIFAFEPENQLARRNDWQQQQQQQRQQQQQQQLRQAGNSDIRERSFVCVDCGKAYAVHRSLWRHLKFECVNAKPKLACDACPYKSPHKWCIENHKKRHHSKVCN